MLDFYRLFSTTILSTDLSTFYTYVFLHFFTSFCLSFLYTHFFHLSDLLFLLYFLSYSFLTLCVEFFYHNGIHLFRLVLLNLLPFIDFHFRDNSLFFQDVTGIVSIYAMSGIIFECAKRVPSPVFPYSRFVIPFSLILNSFGDFSLLPIILFYILLFERVVTWTVSRPFIGWFIAFLLTVLTSEFFTVFLSGIGDSKSISITPDVFLNEHFWSVFTPFAFLGMFLERPTIEFEERFFPDLLLLFACVCMLMQGKEGKGGDLRATAIVICVTGFEKIFISWTTSGNKGERKDSSAERNEEEDVEKTSQCATRNGEGGCL